MTTLIIAQLTIRETQRRRILWVALLMGLLLLVVFGIGFNEIYADMTRAGLDPEQAGLFVSMLLTAGLYAINFLIIMMAVLTSVTAISSEVDTHTIETLLTKPVRRWEIVMGKWVGYALLLAVYVVTMTGGTLGIVYWISGYVADSVVTGMALMVLEGLLILALTITGGTRLSSLANGVMAFMLYGIAFIGGWVEQIGAMLRNETAVDIGIAISLLLPSEILWKKAVTMFQPRLLDNPLIAGPFAIASQPNDLMIAYALLYLAGLILLGLWSFTRRDF
jgi:ABC-type transport system involved in multi-copper enzyme maturation permease subunit